jgi:hypothetical protein
MNSEALIKEDNKRYINMKGRDWHERHKDEELHGGLHNGHTAVRFEGA